jgi:hypothetical protein
MGFLFRGSDIRQSAPPKAQQKNASLPPQQAQNRPTEHTAPRLVWTNPNPPRRGRGRSSPTNSVGS